MATTTTNNPAPPPTTTTTTTTINVAPPPHPPPQSPQPPPPPPPPSTITPALPPSTSTSTSTATGSTSTSSLFSVGLISAEVAAALPPGYTMRPLERADYGRGFLDVLRVLTAVGDIGEEAWGERYSGMAASSDYFVLVIEETASRRCVGAGTLIVERKFVRNLGLVGHIEDVAVLGEMQGKQFGTRIIQALDHIAAAVGCYKAILDCQEKNEGFYVKCGYKKSNVQMAHYFGDHKQLV